MTQLPDEIPHLGFAAFGDDEDFFTVKGTMEALAEAFGVRFDYERAEDVPYLHPGISASPPTSCATASGWACSASWPIR